MKKKEKTLRISDRWDKQPITKLKDKKSNKSNKNSNRRVWK